MSDNRSLKAKTGVSTSLAIIVFSGLLCLPGNCLASDCLAYVGPGSGITMLWALLAVLGGILFIVLGLVLWPVRVLLRAIRKNKSKNVGVNSPSPNAKDSEVAGDD